MTLAAQRPRAWTDLGVDRRSWVISGVFQLGGATYETTFASEPELARFMDFLLAAPDKPATSRLYLHSSVVPLKPEHYLSNLRFQFDAEQCVAAAVVLVIDREQGGVLSWMTSGNAGHSQVVLAHDSWNEHETLFPPESFITVPQLRQVVTTWAFGDVVPPPVATWTDVSGVGWF